MSHRRGRGDLTRLFPIRRFGTSPLTQHHCPTDTPQLGQAPLGTEPLVQAGVTSSPRPLRVTPGSVPPPPGAAGQEEEATRGSRSTAQALSSAAGRGPVSPTSVPAGARLAVLIPSASLMSLICSSLTGAGTCLEALAEALLKSHFNLPGAGTAQHPGAAGHRRGASPTSRRLRGRAGGAEHPPSPCPERVNSFRGRGEEGRREGARPAGCWKPSHPLKGILPFTDPAAAASPRCPTAPGGSGAPGSSPPSPDAEPSPCSAQMRKRKKKIKKKKRGGWEERQGKQVLLGV